MDVWPAGCQQRAGLRSLRSLRPLPTSTASPLCGNLYPSGPSPCPCPGVDTPARCRIPPSPALPVCKKPLSAPRGMLARASRVQKAPFCPREQPAAASRVQIGPPCPREQPAPGQKTLKTVRRRVGGLLPGQKTAKTVPAGAGKAECENRRGVGGGSESWRGRKQAPNLHSSVFFSGNNCYICQN